jgi:hypothetical protein
VRPSKLTLLFSSVYLHHNVTSHWPIFSSIRISLLILGTMIVSLCKIKGKMFNLPINIYYLMYRWFVFANMYFWEQYHIEVKPEMQDAMRIPFQAKHINNSIFIEDLLRWRQWRHYNVALLHIEINDNMSVSRFLLDNTYHHV